MELYCRKISEGKKGKKEENNKNRECTDCVLRKQEQTNRCSWWMIIQEDKELDDKEDIVSKECKSEYMKVP
jgi:hypothetical protein